MMLAVKTYFQFGFKFQVLKVPKTSDAAFASLQHVWRHAGAHALLQVLPSACQCSASLLALLLALAIVVCWRFEVLLFS